MRVNRPRQCLPVIARTHVSTYVHAYGVRVRIEKKKRQPVVLCARDHRAPLSKATSSRLYREKITSRFSTYILSWNLFLLFTFFILDKNFNIPSIRLRIFLKGNGYKNKGKKKSLISLSVIVIRRKEDMCYKRIVICSVAFPIQCIDLKSRYIHIEFDSSSRN